MTGVVTKGRPWGADLHEMHAKFGVHEAVRRMDQVTLNILLGFRMNFLREEMRELEEAAGETVGQPRGKQLGEGDPEKFVDAIIDWIVVGIGTLDLFGVDPQRAWEAVRAANLAKEVGVNESRPNPLGLPDLVKPPGWTPPSHHGNTGTLDEAMGLLGCDDEDGGLPEVGGEGGGA